MRKKIRYIIILFAVIAVAIHWDSVRIAQTKDRKPMSEMIVATYDVDKLRIDDSVETLVIVQAEPEEVNTTGILFVYTRNTGEDGTRSAWKDEIIGMPVVLGKKGMGKTAPGDRKTPVGIYRLSGPFGSGSPQQGFPANYTQISGNDPEYRYCLRIGYDGDPESVVLLQCFDKDAAGTDGSVSVDEDTMKRILCLYKEGKSRILINEKGSFSQYY